MAKMNWSGARKRENDQKAHRKEVEATLHGYAVERAQKKAGYGGMSERQILAKFEHKHGSVQVISPSKPKHRRRHQPTRQRAPDVVWPIYVTSGTNPDGTLKTHVLTSREHADQLGFTWAGQPSGSSAR